MSAAEILEHFRRLPSEEQQRLLDLLNNELGQGATEVDIAEFERRAEELRHHPDRGIPLEVVRAEMRKRLETSRE